MQDIPFKEDQDRRRNTETDRLFSSELRPVEFTIDSGEDTLRTAQKIERFDDYDSVRKGAVTSMTSKRKTNEVKKPKIQTNRFMRNCGVTKTLDLKSQGRKRFNSSYDRDDE